MCQGLWDRRTDGRARSQEHVELCLLNSSAYPQTLSPSVSRLFSQMLLCQALCEAEQTLLVPLP